VSRPPRRYAPDSRLVFAALGGDGELLVRIAADATRYEAATALRAIADQLVDENVADWHGQVRDADGKYIAQWSLDTLVHDDEVDDEVAP